MFYFWNVFCLPSKFSCAGLTAWLKRAPSGASSLSLRSRPASHHFLHPVLWHIHWPEGELFALPYVDHCHSTLRAPFPSEGASSLSRWRSCWPGACTVVYFGRSRWRHNGAADLLMTDGMYASNRTTSWYLLSADTADGHWYTLICPLHAIWGMVYLPIGIGPIIL